MRTRVGVAVAVLSLVAACGAPAVESVSDGTYEALVPTLEQFTAGTGADIPGGYVGLRAAGIDEVGLRVEGDAVTFILDGTVVVTRQVVERTNVVDSEGTGPFKAQKEILVLGSDPLMLGDLSIDDPVVWPGSFEGSPVTTVKPRNEADRGPVISCGADESCLLLSLPIDPTGDYENANNPARNESPVVSLAVSQDTIEFTLTTGEKVSISRSGGSSTRACGLSENPVWDVPPDVDVPIDDPVLVSTVCPTNPGDAIQMIIMDRSAIPVLAPLILLGGGEWCEAGPACLWFAPM